MSARRHIGFGSTPRFSALYKTVKGNTDNKGRLAYAKYDPSLGVPPTEEQIVLLEEYQPLLPVLTFTGSEKLHGENMAVCYSRGELWVQGRNSVRTVLGDQNGMAAFVEGTKSTWMQIFHLLEGIESIDMTTHTVVLDMEWAGGNIQKGNAACSGTDKGAYLFDYFRVISNSDDTEQLFSTSGISYPSDRIYNMASFSSFSINLDFNKPDECEEKLEKLALFIEDNSPIATYFNKPDNVGEGAYLYCAEKDKPVYRLKTKGEKHGGKPKKERNSKQGLTTEAKKHLSDIADSVTPVWRITQAITETNSTERKHVGEVIKWVLADVAKEDIDMLAAEKLTIAEIKGFVATIVKDYFFDSIKGF